MRGLLVTSCPARLESPAAREQPHPRVSPDGMTRKTGSGSTRRGHRHPGGPRWSPSAGGPSAGEPAGGYERRPIPTISATRGWRRWPEPARSAQSDFPREASLVRPAAHQVCPEVRAAPLPVGTDTAVHPLRRRLPPGGETTDGERARPARPLIRGCGTPETGSEGNHSTNQIPPLGDPPPDGGQPLWGGQAPELGWIRSVKTGTSAPREMQQWNWGSSTSGVYSPRESVSGARLVRASPGPMLSWASASSGISLPWPRARLHGRSPHGLHHLPAPEGPCGWLPHRVLRPQDWLVSFETAAPLEVSHLVA